MTQSTIEARLWVIGKEAMDIYRVLHQKVSRVPGVISIDENVTDAGETVNIIINVEFPDSATGVKLYKKVIRLLGNHHPVKLKALKTCPSDLYS